MHLTQCTDKSFEALIGPKSLGFTFQKNLHILQGYAGTDKASFLIKRDFSWKEMHEDINEFIQNCHTCTQHSHQKQAYSYIHMIPPKNH